MRRSGQHRRRLLLLQLDSQQVDGEGIEVVHGMRRRPIEPERHRELRRGRRHRRLVYQAAFGVVVAPAPLLHHVQDAGPAVRVHRLALPGATVTLSTRTRSFSSRTRWFFGAAATASRLAGQGMPWTTAPEMARVAAPFETSA